MYVCMYVFSHICTYVCEYVSRRRTGSQNFRENVYTCIKLSFLITIVFLHYFLFYYYYYLLFSGKISAKNFITTIGQITEHMVILVTSKLEWRIPSFASSPEHRNLRARRRMHLCMRDDQNGQKTMVLTSA
jgi:hypothetical protein